MITLPFAYRFLHPDSGETITWIRFQPTIEAARADAILLLQAEFPWTYVPVQVAPTADPRGATVSTRT